MNMKKVVVLALTMSVLMGLGSGSAWAEPIATDRPTFSYGSSALMGGEVQLETGISYTDGVIDPITPTFRFGLVDNLELRLAGPTVLFGGVDGRVVPLELGAKWAFLTGGDFTSAALVHLLADISEDVPPSEDRFGFLAVYAWGLGLSDRVGLGGNLAARYEDAFSGSASAAVTVGVVDGVSAFGEVWFTGVEGESLVNTDVGVLWVPRDPIQVDAFVGNYDLGGQSAWFYGLGLSLRVDSQRSAPAVSRAVRATTMASR